MAQTDSSVQGRAQTAAARNRQKFRIAAAALLIVVVGSAAYWWFFSRNRVSTDNAYVTADAAMVSSRVPGTVSAVHVQNDCPVSAGDVLVELDPSDYRAEAEKNRAALARTQAEQQQQEVTVRLTEEQTSAHVAAAEAALRAARDNEQRARLHVAEREREREAEQAEHVQTKRDAERFANLFKEGAGSEQQRDRSNTAYLKARAQVESSDAQIAAAQAALAASRQDVERASAQLEASKSALLQTDVEKRRLAGIMAKLAETKAALEIAELNLSYTTIRAPITGYVAQKSVEVGERASPGQPMLAVVPLENAYVEANFKETQLTDVRVGQKVDISADIYPGVVFHGKVGGIRAGTGAAFSLLPPENATGNWIKVVQRVPVRIYFDPAPPQDAPLRMGLSLEVTVHTDDSSGPRLLRSKTANIQQGKLP